MSLANMLGKLTREEMKNIMAGRSDDDQNFCNDQCTTNADCPSDRYCGGGNCNGQTIKRCNKYP